MMTNERENYWENIQNTPRALNCNDGRVSKVMLGLNADVETVDTGGVGGS